MRDATRAPELIRYGLSTSHYKILVHVAAMFRITTLVSLILSLFLLLQ